MSCILYENEGMSQNAPGVPVTAKEVNQASPVGSAKVRPASAPSIHGVVTSNFATSFMSKVAVLESV